MLFRDADNYVVRIYADRNAGGLSDKELLSLMNAEIQSICIVHVSTLDDSLIRSNPRPNPVPRVYVEQGNELSRMLWLSWEE